MGHKKGQRVITPHVKHFLQVNAHAASAFLLSFTSDINNKELFVLFIRDFLPLDFKEDASSSMLQWYVVILHTPV